MQQGHAAEGPRAGAALVLLHLGVSLQVGAKVGAVGKSSITVLTSKGAFTWLEEDKKKNCEPQESTSLTNKKSVLWSLFYK